MRAFVPLSRDLIKDAPDWDDAQPITRAFEERLYDYYWLRRYWPIETYNQHCAPWSHAASFARTPSASPGGARRM